MFLIPSETDLVSAFRPRDRKALELPEGASFPMTVRDYLAWVEPTGVRVFLVFQDPESKRPLGIAFRRDGAGGGGGNGGRMCDWCHSWGSAQDIGLLTTARNSRRRVGVGLCMDLRCRDKIEQSADLAGRSAVQARKRVLERMVRFAREGLGIEAVPEQ